MAKMWDFFAHEDDYPLLDEEACAGRLSRALQFRTVDRTLTGVTDVEQFAGLRDFFARAYPHVFSAGTVETVDRSLLISIPGTDPSLAPVVLMGHMDVVPVIAGTEDDWTYDAFSGHIDDTYVWGRGAMDMKSTVTGNFEAAEYLLSQGVAFRRGLIFALGQDEETVQTGAAQLGALLADRGVSPAFVVDEGNAAIRDAAPFGCAGTHVMYVCVAEKGYTDVILRVKSEGGHSSNPFGGSSLAILSEAITRICQADWGAYLTQPVVGMLEGLAPYMHDSPLVELVQGGAPAIRANEAAIVELARADRNLFPYVANTCAPTMIEGGSQANNVLPQDMCADINFRMHQGLSCADVLARCREILADMPVEVDMEPTSMEPGAISRADDLGMEALVRAASRYFVDPETGDPLPLVSSIVVGATDARMYEPICDQCLRFTPYVVDEDEAARGVHGTNERITRRAYMQGIRFVIRLLEDVCVASSR